MQLWGCRTTFSMMPRGLYLPTPLMGFELVNSEYVAIPSAADGSVHSPVLGLDFHLKGEGLGLYDPIAAQWVQTPAEASEARAEQAEAEAATTPRTTCPLACTRLILRHRDREVTPIEEDVDKFR